MSRSFKRKKQSVSTVELLDEPLTIERFVVGGDGLARLQDGRVAFISDVLPDEIVSVALTHKKKDFVRGYPITWNERHADRIDTICPNIARGCGGCDFAYLDPEIAPNKKAEIVQEALQRIAKKDSIVCRVADPLPYSGFRTTMRSGVIQGHMGLRKKNQHAVVPLVDCHIVDPLLFQIIQSGHFPDAEEVTVRVSKATGEALVVVAPNKNNVSFLPLTFTNRAGELVPAQITVLGLDELQEGVEASIQEDVAGRSWTISAGSFFQTRPDGTEQLVAIVKDFVRPYIGNIYSIVDAYCGVGLFGGSLADLYGPNTEFKITGIEKNISSVQDARENLADLNAEIVCEDVQSWTPSPADLVVADPSRLGLGSDVIATLSATNAKYFVLVACDPASFARDTKLLEESGYLLQDCVVVDMFPHTHHIETVGFYVRNY